MNRIFLFVTAVISAGFFAATGSMVGHLGGSQGLMAGGVIGGLLGVMLAARIAVWRRWIARSDFRAVTLGGAVGFLLAAFIAVRTLSSPVGPVLSTLLVGVGALAGLQANRARKGPSLP